MRKKWDKRDQSKQFTNQTIGILKKEKSKLQERKQFKLKKKKEQSKKNKEEKEMEEAKYPELNKDLRIQLKEL